MRNKNLAGVTLLELIITIAVLAIIGTGMVALITTAVKSYKLGEQELVDGQSISAAMVRIVRTARSGEPFDFQRYTLRVGVIYDGEQAVAQNISELIIKKEYRKGRVYARIQLRSVYGSFVETLVSVSEATP